MIRLQRRRDVAGLPPDFTGERLHAKLIKLVQARLKSGDEIKFEGAIGDWKKAKDELKRDSFDKCAYCESDTAKVAHGDVEHFRPKSKYWWLALCVDNYVYSCQICNQTFKSDEFPVTKDEFLVGPKLPTKLPTTEKALRALTARISPDPALVSDKQLLSAWFKEKAELPHPYLQDPEPLFGWAVSEVNEEVHLVVAPGNKLASRRAVQAVTDYLGLNRETLTRSRYLVYSNLSFVLDAWETGNANLRAKAEKQVRQLCGPEQQYAGMSRYFAKERGFVI